MLYEAAPLTPDDQRVIDEIDNMRESLRSHIRPPQRWDRQLRRSFVASAIRGSTAIEGYVATVDDVADMIAGESPLETNEKTVVEIEGYQQAMTYIQRLSSAGADFSYSKGLLNGLHFMMQGHHLQQEPGWWRTSRVYVTSPDNPRIAAYTAPEADRVPHLMTELVEWLNSDPDIPLLPRAAMAHLNLVAIHPWRDGNGRMSRALQTLVLAREGILAPEFSSIEEWLGRSQNTYRYYEVLAEVVRPTWTPSSDTHPWLVFCLRAHHQQAQYIQQNIGITRRVWSFLEDTIERHQFPERVIYALYPAAMQHRVRRATYQTDAQCSEQQAQRDIRQLVQTKWLTSRGDAQARYYTSGPRFPEHIINDVIEPRPLMDPYKTA